MHISSFRSSLIHRKNKKEGGREKERERDRDEESEETRIGKNDPSVVEVAI